MSTGNKTFKYLEFHSISSQKYGAFNVLNATIYENYNTMKESND